MAVAYKDLLDPSHLTRIENYALMAKAAVEGLGRALAAEWAPKIRVNVLAPSLTNTPLASSFFSTEDRILSGQNSMEQLVEEIHQLSEEEALEQLKRGVGSRLFAFRIGI